MFSFIPLLGTFLLPLISSFSSLDPNFLTQRWNPSIPVRVNPEKSTYLFQMRPVTQKAAAWEKDTGLSIEPHSSSQLYAKLCPTPHRKPLSLLDNPTLEQLSQGAQIHCPAACWEELWVGMMLSQEGACCAAKTQPLRRWHGEKSEDSCLDHQKWSSLKIMSGVTQGLLTASCRCTHSKGHPGARSVGMWGEGGSGSCLDQEPASRGLSIMMAPLFSVPTYPPGNMFFLVLLP